jgi:hypothetical protein
MRLHKWVDQYLFIYVCQRWLGGTDRFATFMAVNKIMNKDIDAHRKWMLRSYAITFSAVTLRLYQLPLMVLFGEFEPAYKIVAWLCWVSNLLIIEHMIRRKRISRMGIQAVEEI